MTGYVKHIQNKVTPQTEKISGSAQVQNSAGGYSYAVDDWTRLERFLILGTVGGTYYAGERKLTIENAEVVKRCSVENPARTVQAIVDISIDGRAPKNDPAVFALAIAASMGGTSNENVRRLALEALPKVCRIGTHLFQFVEAINELRGWGKTLRKAVAKWYTNQEANSLAYGMTKYAQRDGWSHRDVLRLAHPKAKLPGQDACFRYAVTSGDLDTLGKVREITRFNKTKEGVTNKVPALYNSCSDIPSYLNAVQEAKAATSNSTICNLIEKYNLPREVIPTQFLNSLDVWNTLLTANKGMPLTAMIRNLGKMTSLGLVKPLSDAERFIVEALDNDDNLKKARVHPIFILNALRQYSQGKGDKGSLTWNPSSMVKEALDKAFYAAFRHIVPSGKRFLLGVDVSGSMSASIAGMSLSCREAAAAMAMVITRTEPWTFCGKFTQRFTEFDLGQSTSLEEAVSKAHDRNFSSTDCSQPILHAIENKLTPDVFVIITDNETYASSIHPSQALKKYRNKTGINAKMAVFGMTSTQFTIADPNDKGMIDFAGLDTSAPQFLTEWAKG